MTSYDVKIFDLQERTDRKHRPWRLRWAVAGHRFERRYATKALADSFRSRMIGAMRKGEAFDEKSGLPESELRNAQRLTWYEHALSYVAMKWPGAKPKTRKAIVEALVTITTGLVEPSRKCPAPDLLRRALFQVFVPGQSHNALSGDMQEALSWIMGASIPLTALTDSEVVRRGLSACAQKLDGKPAAANTISRKRAVFYNALGYAVERGLLDFNPLDKVQWKAPAVADRVDRRVVASTAQVEQILAAMPDVHPRGQHHVAFFGCLYYAGMRPSEASALRRDDCVLPRKGWGRLVLTENAPHAGSQWTDDGAVRDVHALKHRADGTVRRVPIPPELVRHLRDHVKRFGVAPDGRLFRAARGGYLPTSTYLQVWRAARSAVFTQQQVASPLAGRPYDLRHAAVTLWLNGGVPAPEVAARVGHGVDVLLRVYAGCIDGEESIVNGKIDQALRQSRGPRRGQVA